MEYSNPAERHQRPEFDRDQPATLFTYAKAKLIYLRERVSDLHLPSSVEYLGEELEQYVTSHFETMPPVTVVSNDVYYTLDIKARGSEQIIDSQPLPMNGDAELLKAHVITGSLFGFHKGDNDDLRAYVSINDATRKMMGGVYTPLLSIGVENSDIQFTELSVEEELEKIGVQIREQLKNCSDETIANVTNILRLINDPESVTTKKLHDTSPVLAEVARHDETSSHFIDTLIEYIKYRLRLTYPQDIGTTSYREVITESRIPSYKPRQEPKNFNGVIPDLGLIGESANKSLGLLFINSDKAVQIPVQYITSIRRTQS